MPARNALKKYVQNGYYHIYNRGVEKRLIFQEERDYKIFLSYLKFYLLPNLQGLSLKVPPSRQLNNFAGKIDLIAYALMPNHFHLLIRQTGEQDISYFMRSIITKYVRAFNTHYQRVGHLFQDRYKAVLIDSEEQLLHVSRYIHLNILDLIPHEPNIPSRTVLEGLLTYPYSSYANYIGLFTQSWVKTQQILEILNQLYGKSYEEYMSESLLTYEDSP